MKKSKAELLQYRHLRRINKFRREIRQSSNLIEKGKSVTYLKCKTTKFINEEEGD